MCGYYDVTIYINDIYGIIIDIEKDDDEYIKIFGDTVDMKITFKFDSSFYYKLDESLPKDLPFHVANTKLAKKFNIVSPEIILIDKDMKTDKVESLVEDLKDVEGIDLVLAPSTMDSDIEDLLPEDLTKRLTSKDYQMVIMNSSYEIASNKLNKQVVDIDKIVKKYDKKGIIAGEGPLMKDLVTIADHDFKMVNYTSIAVIFVIMLIVLQSFGII